MNHRFVRSAIFSAIVAICLGIAAEAANKTKPSSSEADALDGLLESEARSESSAVDRRDSLKPETRPNVESNPVWWQAGYILSGTQWVTYEESIATGESATRLNEYQEQRTALLKLPHGQWQLANWCRKNGLLDQERVHLLRVLIERDPTVDKDSVYERLGCQKVGDVWVSPQERLEAAEMNAEVEKSRRRWNSKFEKLIPHLKGTPKQRASAEKQLAEITDPSAVPVIVNLLCTTSSELAEFGITMLDRTPEYQASRALAGQAVFSPWKPVRAKAVASLKKRKLEEFAPDLLLLLSNPVKTKQDVAVQETATGPSMKIGAPDLRINWDYAWIEETHDTIRVGIRRLFPISTPANLHLIISIHHPGIAGFYDQSTGQRVATPDAAIDAAAIEELAEQSQLIDYSVEKLNDFRADLNERVGKVLAECTNEPVSSEPRSWWNWWTNYSSVAQPAQKEVVIVDERQGQPNVPSFSRTTTQMSCLVAGTPVWTERGFVAIEQILPGDRVLSKEVKSGQLSYKPVLQTTVRDPVPVHRFCVNGDPIIASLGHHFWVSGDGWTKLRELIPGQPLHTVTGMQRITDVEDEGRLEKVYNLVVADFHTYFVGNAMVLSHDVLPPNLTNVKVPGLSLK